MCKDGGYLNLIEILPGCFKKPEHTHELLDKVSQSCHLLADECHVCSSGFLTKCMATFKRLSEAEAVKLIKKGKRPEKLIKKQSAQGQSAPLDKKKSSGGGKKKLQKREDSHFEEAQTQAREAVCPFREQEIAARLTEAS